jgi:3-hydroxybutyryl-CoA dehydrogenase
MLADLIGLDVLYNSTLIFFEEYKERRFASPPLLTKMVTLGFLGKKTGKGFYDWSDPNNVKPSNLEI